jgi:hypothetical protein
MTMSNQLTAGGSMTAMRMTTALPSLGWLLLVLFLMAPPARAQFAGNGPLGPTNGVWLWGTNVTGVQGRGMLNTNFLFMQGYLKGSGNLDVGGTASMGAAVVTNRATHLDGSTNSGPVTFPMTSRAWVTFGSTNTGIGINGGEVTLFTGGNASIQATVNGSQRVLTLSGNVDNSQNQVRLSDFGPRWIEDQRQGRFSYTNAWSATAVTNRLYGVMEFANITSGSNTYAGGALIYATSGELRVADASGNHTTISPHAKDSPGSAVDDGIANPIVFKHENAYLGETEWLHLSAIAREVERLSGKQFVFAITNTPRSWAADQDAAQAAYDAERAAEIIRRQTDTNITVRPVRDVKAPEPERIKRVREAREKKK